MTIRGQMTLLVTVLALTGIACSGSSPEGETIVFAASSLTETTDRLLEARAPGDDDVTVVTGGSASLAAQIRDGAPVDLFLSASEHWAREAAASCSPACQIRSFARNSLVLAVPSGNPGAVRDLTDLSRPELTVVLCAPDVPCGALGSELTSAHGVTPMVDSLEPSVRAVRSRLELGEADVGLIYATDVTASLEVIEPGAPDPHTTYFYVVLDEQDGLELADLLTGPVGQDTLAGLGFDPVPE